MKIVTIDMISERALIPKSALFKQSKSGKAFCIFIRYDYFDRKFYQNLENYSAVAVVGRYYTAFHQW